MDPLVYIANFSDYYINKKDWLQVCSNNGTYTDVENMASISRLGSEMQDIEFCLKIGLLH